MTAPVWLMARPIAHRGLHDEARGLAENTIGAAEAAIAGRYAIECDIQLSADGEAIVFHDEALDRLTAETGRVGERSAAELGTLPVAGGPDTIPSLSGFLDRIAGRAAVVIEIKSRFDGDDRLARRATEVIRGRPEPVAVKSFDPEVVRIMRQIAPAIPCGIVAQSCYDEPGWRRLSPERRRAMAELSHWSETEPDFVSWRYRDLPGQFTLMPRILAGVPVMTWTIRSAAEAEVASAFADQIVFEGFEPD